MISVEIIQEFLQHIMEFNHKTYIEIQNEILKQIGET